MKKILLSFSSFYLAILLYLMTIDIPFVKFPNYWFHDLAKLIGLLVVGLIIASIELKLFSRKSENTSTVKLIKPLESSVIPTYIY